MRTKKVGGRCVSASEAVQAVKSGMRVRFPTGHVPLIIADHLAARLDDLSDVEISHTSAIAMFPWFEPGFERSFSVVQEHWAAPITWPMMKDRTHDYMPMPFSLRFKAANEGRTAGEERRCEVVCVQTSPPDSNGMVNLGRAIFDAPQSMRHADVVIAEVVQDMPIIRGDGQVPASLVTYFVDEGSTTTFSISAPADEAHVKMAEYTADLIHDGDTLQIGAGASAVVAQALMKHLRERTDLGWHSEQSPIGIPSLIQQGVMTSKFTAPHPGIAAASIWGLAVEDGELDFIQNNPAVEGREISRITNPSIIAQIPNFKALNSVTMIDLTGQAAAESVGTIMYSGVGGLLEFMIGSLWSPGGRSILLSCSTDRSGERSRIVPIFPEGTQVAVPRTLVDTVVTEYGVARLWGKTARERAKELTAVAAPQFRDELEAASRRLFYP